MEAVVDDDDHQPTTTTTTIPRSTSYRSASSHDANKQRIARRISLVVVAAVVAVTVKENVLLSLQQVISLQSSPAAVFSDEPSAFFVPQSKNETGNTERHASSGSLSRISKTYPPLSCWDLFHAERNVQPKSSSTSTSSLQQQPLQNPMADPNDGRIHVRYTYTDPPFWVAVHVPEFDSTRWSIMEYGRYYERAETEAMVTIVRTFIQEQQQQQDQHQLPVRVIDVGGNIGWFTLAAVASATQRDYPIVVHVFEPNPKNHYRFCESLFFNQWLHRDDVAIHLYNVGVTSTAMAQDKTKIGRISVETAGKGTLRTMESDNVTGTVTFPLVSLDQMGQELEWCDIPADQNKQRHQPEQQPSQHYDPIAILKIDVEGFELEVLEGATHLLQSQVIQNIFFEGNVRTMIEHNKFRRMAQLLVNSGYRAYMIIGLRVTVPVTSTLQDNSTASNITRYMDAIKDECEGPKKKRRQCNMWWRPLSAI